MRISDWSSDVCSSDLRRRQPHRGLPDGAPEGLAVAPRSGPSNRNVPAFIRSCRPPCDPVQVSLPDSPPQDADGQGKNPLRPRSEEHTSELQSLMRISYAVFCLKKKNNNNNTTMTDHQSN